MIDYDIYYRSLIVDYSEHSWDLFLSSFNSSLRVRELFTKVHSKEKFWVISPEYCFDHEELPDDQGICLPSGNELEQMKFLSDKLNLGSYIGKNICVDITGFMRPQIAFLVKLFNAFGFKKVDFIYSEPTTYKKKENTSFSAGEISQVRAMLGYTASPKVSNNKSLVVILAGYDSRLMTKAINFSEDSDVAFFIGFPSLQPDMYQECMLKVIESTDLGNVSDILFAPASDPFSTAAEVSHYINKSLAKNKYTQVYIYPLSTKVQTLGIAFMHLLEFTGKNVSIHFPFSSRYEKETSSGLSRSSLYTVEF